MKKNKTRSFDFRKDGNIGIVRWNETFVVTIRSNAHGVQPIGWIRKGKQKNIQQLAVIAPYNRGMG